MRTTAAEYYAGQVAAHVAVRLSEPPPALLPCPFCGAAGELRALTGEFYTPLVEAGGPWVVSCSGECPLDFGPADGVGSRAAVVAAWNRRAGSADGGEP